MKSPLVSIIIPAYNASEYLGEAIESALAQTYENTEIIVVNDGSPDGGATEAVARSYGDRIRYFYKENGGVSTALNLGIREARGEYISWLSHDDAYLPTKLEEQVRLLSDYDVKAYTLVLCGARFMDKDSRLYGNPQVPNGLSFSRVSTPGEALLALYKTGTFNGCALLIPRAAFLECGGFDETLRFNQDAFMWTKFFLAGYSLIASPTVGVLSRVHEKQQTQRLQDVFHRDCVYMAKTLIPALAHISTRRQNYLYAYALYNAKYNNPTVVRDAIAAGRAAGRMPLSARLSLSFVALWGRIRPAVRRLYYRIFRRMKTQ